MSKKDPIYRVGNEPGPDYKCHICGVQGLRMWRLGASSCVELTSNWGYWDQLDGETLKDGELLRIEWPNGTVEELPVRVRDVGCTIHDMGHQYTGQDIRAFVEKVVNGKAVLIEARGLLAERVS